MAVRFWTFIGQPGRLMTVALGTRSFAPIAPVGPPWAAGRPPSKAHDPTAIVASAPSIVARAVSMKVWPPIVQ